MFICVHYTCHSKTINAFVQCKEYDKMVPYASSVGMKMECASMLGQLLFSNSQDALNLTKDLINTEGDRSPY